MARSPCSSSLPTRPRTFRPWWPRRRRGADRKSLLVSAFNSGVLRLSDGPPRTYNAADGLTEDVRTVVEPSSGRLRAPWASHTMRALRAGSTLTQA